MNLLLFIVERSSFVHGAILMGGEGGTFWAAEVSINIHHKHKKELIKINKQRKKPMILKLENI